MRIIFMGTPDFAVGTLRALHGAGHEIVCVVSQPDKPKGRGKNLCPTPVKEAALALGLPVFQPRRIREDGVLERLAECRPDVIVVAAFGQILPEAVLSMAPYGCINVHASLLPKYRGAAPIQWAILNGETETGVTIMRMDAGLDTGDVIAREIVPIAADETGGSLFEKLAWTGSALLVRTLPAIADGTAVYESQPAESPTAYARMIDKKMGAVDWAKDAAAIERLVRGLNPWPSAYTKIGGKTLKIWKGSVRPGLDKTQPGTVIAAGGDGICVQTGEGALLLEEVQLEGKKRMGADAFLRGYALRPGMRLGD